MMPVHRGRANFLLRFGKFPLHPPADCVPILSMYGIAARSLTDRFAWLFAGLCRAVGVDAHTRRMEAALAWAIWNRVRLLGERLIALAARVEAGRAARRRKSTPHPDPLAQGEREKAGGSGI